MAERPTFSRKEKRDIKTLMKFVAIFCRQRHDAEKSLFSLRQLDVSEIEKKQLLLCQDCRRLLTYGLMMRLKCPHDPKPMCKACETQCYRGEYRAKIREIMKFSGIYLVKRGRLDLLYHYLK